MLIKDIHLRSIADGSVSVAFRKWKKAAVKEGSLLKTSIGLVNVEKIEEIALAEIKEEDVRAAGYQTEEEVIKSFYKNAEVQIYKIHLRYFGEDPRIELRENVDISDEEMVGILEKLERYDKFSKQGSWTKTVLRAIEENPKLRAANLGELLVREKDWLKINVRKLKNLGLTISHHPGYEISPLGKKVLEAMNKQAK